MPKPLNPAFVRVEYRGSTYYADTLARTACYGGDLCRFEHAYWYDGSVAAVAHAYTLTAAILAKADAKLVKAATH